MESSSVAASDQQTKELLQEVTRLQVLGELINTLKEKERNKIKLNSESVKVRFVIDVSIFLNPPDSPLDGEDPH